MERIRTMNQPLQQTNDALRQTGPSIYVLRDGHSPKRCSIIDSGENRLSVDAGFSTLRAGETVVVVFMYHPAGRTLLRHRQAAVVGRIRNRVLLRILPKAGTPEAD